MSRLHEGLGGLLPPGEIPLSEAGFTEGAQLAYCPARREAAGVGSCAYIDCRNCAYRPEGGRWLCTGCVRDGRSLPYWTDGACDSCGGYSIVLALEVP